MNTRKAKYLLVVFDHPGPLDPQVELFQSVIPLLMRETDFEGSEECKFKTSVKPVKDIQDLRILKWTMVRWLREEGEMALSFDFTPTGFYAPNARYKFFQAAWVVPMSGTRLTVAMRQQAKYEAGAQDCLEEFKSGEVAKPGKRWWQFWKR